MSATINIKTVNANMLVITKVILSPASDGKKNESNDRTGKQSKFLTVCQVSLCLSIGKHTGANKPEN